MHSNASDPIAHPKSSDTHSSQDYVNAPEIDTNKITDAPTEIDNTSNSRRAANFPHDTYSNACVEAKVPTDQVDGIDKNKTFPRGVEYNLRLNSNPNFSGSYTN